MPTTWMLDTGTPAAWATEAIRALFSNAVAVVGAGVLTKSMSREILMTLVYVQTYPAKHLHPRAVVDPWDELVLGGHLVQPVVEGP